MTDSNAWRPNQEDGFPSPDSALVEGIVDGSGEFERCPVCGFPLAVDVSLGCVPDNCSQRR